MLKQYINLHIIIYSYLYIQDTGLSKVECTVLSPSPLHASRLPNLLILFNMLYIAIAMAVGSLGTRLLRIMPSGPCSACV